jgi:hypothetical protein
MYPNIHSQLPDTKFSKRRDAHQTYISVCHEILMQQSLTVCCLWIQEPSLCKTRHIANKNSDPTHPSGGIIRLGGGKKKAHHIIPFHAIHSTWRGRRRIRRSSWYGWLACKSIWRKSSSIFEEREKEHKSSKVLIMSLLSNANKKWERQKMFQKSSRASQTSEPQTLIHPPRKLATELRQTPKWVRLWFVCSFFHIAEIQNGRGFMFVCL